MIYIDFNTELLMNFTRIIKGANFSIFYSLFSINEKLFYKLLHTFNILYCISNVKKKKLKRLAKPK